MGKECIACGKKPLDKDTIGCLSLWNKFQSIKLILWNALLDTLWHNFACVANGLMAKTKKDEPPDMDSSSLPHFDCRLSKYFQRR